jgi:hypothetical protein
MFFFFIQTIIILKLGTRFEYNYFRFKIAFKNTISCGFDFALAHHYNAHEKISWRQKSIIKWLKEGDKCANFFHLMGNSNKRNNTIDSLLINGSLSSNSAMIRDHAVNFYESMFAKSMSLRPRLDDLDFESLSVGKAFSLEALFS